MIVYPYTEFGMIFFFFLILHIVQSVALGVCFSIVLAFKKDKHCLKQARSALVHSARTPVRIYLSNVFNLPETAPFRGTC